MKQISHKINECKLKSKSSNNNNIRSHLLRNQDHTRLSIPTMTKHKKENAKNKGHGGGKKVSPVVAVSKLSNR